ncbi:MAG TPA: hypothetical protein VKP69_13760, partial [Isosphaeraceae bacterium]|nr:hypothetical protein [Isosphaeraceae bacterium]
MTAPDRGGCRSKVPKEVRMGPPYRNVIFDMDGPLINSRPGIHDGIRHVFALKVRPADCDRSPTSFATSTR